jgi:hypothetical protein
MRKKIYLLIPLVMLALVKSDAQTIPAYVDQDSDTIILLGGRLPEVGITEKMRFANDTTRYQYNQLKFYVKTVLPLANKAIELFNDIDAKSANMTNGEKRKYVRSREKEIKTQFEDQLKKLNVTQGKLLVKLINKKSNSTCFKIISYLHNPIKANSYQAWAKLHGIHLNEDYRPENNRELERILKKLGN